jgi:hypothetical protein
MHQYPIAPDSGSVAKAIGVIADSADHEVVREFFELFKTPWEFYQAHRRYDVLICAGDHRLDATAKLLLLYAGRRAHFDDRHGIETDGKLEGARILSYRGKRLPVYGNTMAFPGKRTALLTDGTSRECVAYLTRYEERALGRVGYDLFAEVGKLLTTGQPATNAAIPALDLHIAILRDLITSNGVSLVEIPPVPDGYEFIACLTHDIDHPSIRQHGWDHTTLGFLYRALFGSLRNLLRRRISVRDLITNWMAALKLPFVHLGLAEDFWMKFGDRYLELEKGVCSTFFVIPFKDRPGTTSPSKSPVPAFRAARYGARDIADALRKLAAAGCEIGLHGIDAWTDSAGACEELEEIRRLTGASKIGVRMHWLYSDRQSPMVLEKAGAAYDSTIGYNDTVGYRAGTTQVYKPLAATRLLELPLHVMDTALFYSAYLGLSPREARTILGGMVDNVVHFGGCLTVNWHDRSVTPERLWDRCYSELVEELKERRAWFATSGQATSWFRKRRSAVFENDCTQPHGLRAAVAASGRDGLPGLRLRIHNARESFAPGPYSSEDYVDIAVDESMGTLVPSASGY